MLWPVLRYRTVGKGLVFTCALKMGALITPDTSVELPFLVKLSLLKVVMRPRGSVDG
jgi:hypothetical protein